MLHFPQQNDIFIEDEEVYHRPVAIYRSREEKWQQNQKYCHIYAVQHYDDLPHNSCLKQ